MPIAYMADKQLFHLYNDRISAVLCVVPDRLGRQDLMMPYFGARVTDPAAAVFAEEWHEGSSNDSNRQTAPYAVPTEGRGDHRPTALCARDNTDQPCTELFYVSHVITPGKPALPGLPAVYTEADSEADTLTVTLADPLTGLTALVSYTVFSGASAMTVSMRLENRGSEKLILDNAASAAIHLHSRWDLLHLHGSWASERQVERVPAARLTRQIESTRGASGHEHNPFVAMMAPDADEFSGEVVGVNLVYSGSFRISADENAYGNTRVVCGINPRTLRWHLTPGESFQTPEAVIVYSDEGLNGMSHTMHRLYRTRLCRGKWRDVPRPVLLNNWEGTYFNFNHEKILAIARAAAEVGIELMVLDDGWFGKRDSDNCSLGDWVADRRKLPGGIKALAEDVNALGLRFGLWFEPEMVSPDSDLYRAHPDWCLHVPGRPRTECRKQLTLDMSRPEVQDYVIEAVSRVLRDAPVGYVKWDMNRNFTEAGSAALLDGRSGEIHHRYILGTYRVLEAVTSAFPEVLFESCASGGGRFDPGMLYYMPQTWTSDDTDAVERLKLQYGTSIPYPISSMGAHVSAVPNHQVGRVTPLKTRGDVALGGNFGYELDLTAMSPEELDMVRTQVATVKRLRKTTQQGDFTRLASPFDGNLTAWQFMDDDRAILCVYQPLAVPNPPSQRVRMRDLPADAVYRDEEGVTYTARDLMHTGIVPRLGRHDYASWVTVLERV